jgi:acetyl esterase/lipase
MILSALLSGLVATSCATTGGTPSAAANSGLEEGASPTTSAASAPTRPPEPLDRRDVAYASASPRQRLDLYVPSSGAAPYPLVVWIHGGGWERGDQTLAPDAPVRTLLTDGFAVASVDYRLSQDAPFPAQIDDVKAAVRFLRANAVTWSLDPKRFGAWGDSAGGHLAALLGTTGGVATFDAAALGNVDESSRVQAVVDWYGPFGACARGRRKPDHLRDT